MDQISLSIWAWIQQNTELCFHTHLIFQMVLHDSAYNIHHPIRWFSVFYLFTIAKFCVFNRNTYNVDHTHISRCLQDFQSYFDLLFHFQNLWTLGKCNYKFCYFCRYVARCTSLCFCTRLSSGFIKVVLQSLVDG